MSHRKQQIEATLMRVVSGVLTRRLSDPRVSGMVSVTRVDVSPDCRDAIVYVSVIPEKYQQRTIHGLQHAAGYISSLVRKEIVMRSAPRLRFRLDESLKKQAAVFEAIESGLAREKQRIGYDEGVSAFDNHTEDGLA